VREELRKLEHREKELRDIVLENPERLAGNDWTAQIRNYEYERLDTRAVIEHYGKATLRQFFTTKPCTAIKLRKIENYG
jgi:hypothetical protein